MADVILEARGLVYRTGGKNPVDGIDCKIAAGGHTTVIMGANGAGKSLLLRLLHGLLVPTKGSVLWKGRAASPDDRKKQSMVFQRPVMLKRSVRANLEFPIAASGADRGARVSEALETAGLSKLAAQPARVLSGGEAQRLALARALITEPEVLFLDEPTSNLDPAATMEIENRIRAANAEGISVVMVTHDAGQAKRLARDAIFLHSGRVVETGLADHVLNAPSSDAAQAWLNGEIYLL